MTEQVAKLMKNLDITEKEALQVLADDKAIDQGKPMEFDLSKEDEKIAKKYANSETKTSKKGKKVVTHKENPTKIGLISEIFTFLSEKGFENVEITNKERQIAFKIGENAYELTLVQKRKPKT